MKLIALGISFWAALLLAVSATPRSSSSVPTVSAGKEVPPPRILEKVEPTFPKSQLTKRRVAPIFLLQFLVNEHGSVDGVTVIRSYDPALTPYVLAAVRQWKFSKSTVRGRPVKVRYPLMVRYEVR